MQIPSFSPAAARGHWRKPGRPPWGLLGLLLYGLAGMPGLGMPAAWGLELASSDVRGKGRLLAMEVMRWQDTSAAALLVHTQGEGTLRLQLWGWQLQGGWSRLQDWALSGLAEERARSAGAPAALPQDEAVAKPNPAAGGWLLHFLQERKSWLLVGQHKLWAGTPSGQETLRLRPLYRPASPAGHVLGAQAPPFARWVQPSPEGSTLNLTLLLRTGLAGFSLNWQPLPTLTPRWQAPWPMRKNSAGSPPPQDFSQLQRIHTPQGQPLWLAAMKHGSWQVRPPQEASPQPGPLRPAYHPFPLPRWDAEKDTLRRTHLLDLNADGIPDALHPRIRNAKAWFSRRHEAYWMPGSWQNGWLHFAPPAQHWSGGAGFILLPVASGHAAAPAQQLLSLNLEVSMGKIFRALRNRPLEAQLTLWNWGGTQLQPTQTRQISLNRLKRKQHLLANADLNGDGFQDLLLNLDGKTLEAHLSQGQASRLQEKPLRKPQAGSFFPRKKRLATDLNADGRQELLLWKSNAHSFTLRLLFLR